MISATVSLLVGTNVFSVALADNPTALRKQGEK